MTLPELMVSMSLRMSFLEIATSVSFPRSMIMITMSSRPSPPMVLLGTRYSRMVHHPTLLLFTTTPPIMIGMSECTSHPLPLVPIKYLMTKMVMDSRIPMKNRLQMSPWGCIATMRMVQHCWLLSMLPIVVESMCSTMSSREHVSFKCHQT